MVGNIANAPHLPPTLDVMFQKIMDVLRIISTNRALLLIFGLLVMMLAGSCGGDGDSPTSPDPTSVVIVDKHNANATSPPCGTTDAVCGSNVPNLRSAGPQNTYATPYSANSLRLQVSSVAASKKRVASAFFSLKRTVSGP